MATRIREILLPWDSQPQEAVQFRADLAQELGFYGGFINPQTAWNNGQLFAPGGLQPSPSADGLAIVNTTGTAVAAYPFNGSPESAELTLVIRFCRFGAQPDSGFGTVLHAPKVGGVQDPFIWFIKDAGERVRINTSTNDASGQSWETTTSWPVGEFQIGVLTWVAGSQPIIYRNGKSQTLSASGTTPSGTLKQSIGFLNVNFAGLRMNGALSAGLVFNKAWAAQQVAAYASDLPGLLQLVEPQTIWVPVSAGGATTHATTGALAGAGGAIDGTAAHIAIHGTSGVLAGSGATVDGAAARTRAHPTSGVLAGSGGVVDGTARHNVPHPTTGVLAGAGGAVVGAADHIVPGGTHDTSGALAGGGAVIEGRAAGPQAQDNSGGWPIYRRKKKKDDDEELEPAVIEAVAVVPAPRRMVALEKLIGKKAATQVNEAQLSSAIRMLKRKRQDEELMLM